MQHYYRLHRRSVLLTCIHYYFYVYSMCFSEGSNVVIHDLCVCINVPCHLLYLVNNVFCVWKLKIGYNTNNVRCMSKYSANIFLNQIQTNIMLLCFQTKYHYLAQTWITVGKEKTLYISLIMSLRFIKVTFNRVLVIRNIEGKWHRSISYVFHWHVPVSYNFADKIWMKWRSVNKICLIITLP